MVLALIALFGVAPNSPLRNIRQAAASTYSTTVLGDSAAGYWRLGESSGTVAADSAGTNPGTYGGGYTLGQPGAIAGDADTAVALNGSTGVVALTQSTTLMPATAVSVEGWIKPTSALPDGAALFHSAQANNAGGYALQSMKGHLQMVVYSTASSSTFAQAISTTQINAWTHVVGTWDGATVRIYLNGKLEASTPNSAIYYGTVNQAAQIGVQGSAYWNGTVDEVAVYPTALTAARVATHYQTGSGRVPPGAPTAVTATGGSNQASVSWTAPTATGSSPITGYIVTPHVGATSRTPVTFNSTATTQTITSLGSGTYTFTVVAISAAGSGAASSPSAAATVTGSSAAYPSTVLADSPKGYWRLGEAGGAVMTDATASGTDGVYLGTPGYGKGPGVNDPDTSMDFDGSTVVGRVADSASLALTGALSLEAWVSYPNAPSGSQTYIEKGDGGTGGGTSYRLGYSGTAFVFATCIGTTCTSVTKATSITPFAWYHVVGTRTAAGALTLYLNGAASGSASDSGASLNVVPGPVAIGGPGLPTTNPAWGYLSGRLDEPAVYGTALSAAQVAAHWQAGGYVAGSPVGVTATAGTYSATVSWAPPAYQGTTPITNYQVIPYIGSTAYPPVSASTANSVTVNSLSAGSTYTFSVTAINASGSSAPSAPSAAVTIAGNTPYANTVLGDAPAGYWRLGESTGTAANDASGHANTGTYNGGYTLGQAGAPNGDPDLAVQLDGSSGRVAIPSTAGLSPTGAFSLEAWVNFKAAPANGTVLIGKTDCSSATASAYSLQASSTGFYLGLWQGSAMSTVASTTTIQPGTWYHVVGTRTSAGLESIYVNGQIQNTNSDGGAAINSVSTQVTLGSCPTLPQPSGWNLFNGTLDEAAIYASALSAAQVQNHWYQSSVPPGAVTGVTASAGASQAYIAWTPPALAGRSPISGFTISATPSTGVSGPLVVDASTSAATFTGLSPGTSYTFAVTAFNSNGSGPAGVSAAITPTGTSSTYASTVLADGPSAYWRMDETSGSTMTDATGHGLNASYGGTVTLNQVGAIYGSTDSSISVNGGYAVLPDNTWAHITGALSVEIWVKYASTPGNHKLMTRGNGANYGTSWMLRYTSGTGLQFVDYVTNGTGTVTAPFTPVASTWYHIVATRSAAGVVSMYVNGALIGTGSDPGGSMADISLIGIGGNGQWGSDGFGNSIVGQLDDAAFYSGVLSATQVANHWAASGRGPGAPTSIQATGGANQASVSWTAPTYAGASAVIGYTITPYLGAAALPSVQSGPGTTGLVTGLNGGSSYTFAVSAVNSDGAGAQSVRSGSVSVTGTTWPYSNTVLADSPTAYWRLDESSGTSAADQSGHLNAGTYVGSVVLAQPSLLSGDPDAGVVLNGVNAYVSGPTLAPLQGGNARTVELWFQTASTSQQPLFYSGTTTGTGQTYLVLTQSNGIGNSPPSNTPGLYFAIGSDSMYLPGLSLGDGHAHHVVATLSGTTVQLFVDGATPPGYQWLGTGWSASRSQPFTLPSGAPSTASDVVWLGHGQSTVYGSGSTYFGGEIDEASIYGTALTAARVATHWVSGGHSPGIPQGVNVTAQPQAVQVNWTQPAQVGDSPITGYSVIGYSGTSQVASTTVTGNTSGATLTGLSPAISYTITVAAKNSVYQSPPSTASAAISPLAPTSSALGSYYFYNCDCNDGGQAIANYGLSSQANVPALAQWTIEGWIGGQSSQGTTGSNAAWGMLQGTTDQPSMASPVAGINFGLGGSPLQTAFVWPGSGSYALPGDSSGIAIAFNRGNYSHAALTYDGTTVRGFINGTLLFSQATSAAAIPAGPAGWMDEVALTQTKYDEFRISSVARYTANFTPQTSNFAPDASTMLLWHLDDYGIAKLPSTQVFPGTYYRRPGAFGDSSGHGNHAQVVANGTNCIICGPLFSLYSLAPGVNPGEISGGGSPWICPCTRAATNYPINTATGEFFHTFGDVSIPGRGLPLDFRRTYSSANAGSLGPFGYGWSHSYGGSLSVQGSTATVVAPNGSSVAFTWNGSAYVPPAHVLASLVKNADGSFTFSDKQKSQYKYSSAGLLTQEVDRNGYATTLTYNASSQLTTVADPAGRTLTLAYSGGLVSSLTDTAGSRTVTFTYDGSSNLVQVNDVRGGQTRFSYDANHLMLTMKDPLCVAVAPNCDGVRNTYVNGQVTRQVDGANRVTLFSYQTTAIGTTTTTTDPRGNVTIDEYANNVLLDTTRGKGTAAQATWTYGFDTGTLASTSTADPNGHVTVSSRDGQGNVLARVDALGNATTATYNSFNEPLTVTDPLGVTTTNTYDGNGNLTSSSTPLVGSSPAQNRVTTYTYGDAGHPGDVTQVTDPDGKAWVYTYDPFGYKASATDPMGNRTSYNFDPIGRMTSKVAPKGNITGANPLQFTWNYNYDSSNHLIGVIDPLSNQTTYQFDPNGNLRLVTDPKFNQTQYQYDLDNEVTAEMDGVNSPPPTQRTLQTTYDAAGNVYQQVDGNGNVTTYAYDSRNRKISATDPLGRKTTYGYDAGGNPTSVKDAKGQTTSYAYDSADRLIGVTYSDPGTPSVTYSYDRDGQRLSMLDGSGLTTYAYDSLHRLTASSNGAGSKVSYGYDLKGQLTSLGYPGGTNTVLRTYDGAGRLATVADWLSHTTTYGYDADSNPTQVTYGNGTSRASNYDNADRLMGITDGRSGVAFLTLTYGRDPASLLTSDSGTSYGYDVMNRVTSAGSTSYTYDKGDQLTQIAITGGNTTAQTYDLGGQLKSAVTSNGATQISKLAFAYDANGNRTRTVDQNNVNSVRTYDAGNRLVNDNGAASFAYNGDGLRMSKTASGATTNATWDTAEGLPLLVQDGSAAYVTGLGGLPLEQISGTTVYWYHEDQLGSVRALTDAAGAVQQTYAYDAYGKTSSSSGTLSNPFGFAGQYIDRETGLYYLRARYYDPTTGQFITRDPLAALTRNPYLYASDSPLNRTDASGLCPWCLAVVAVAAVALAPVEIPTAVVVIVVVAAVAATVVIGIAAAHVAHEIYDNVHEARGGGMQPDHAAEGEHYTFERDDAGKVKRWQQWKPSCDPQNPNDWEAGRRFDREGDPHYNKETGRDVPTPHVHDPGTPGGVRPADPEEIPQ